MDLYNVFYNIFPNEIIEMIQNELDCIYKQEFIDYLDKINEHRKVYRMIMYNLLQRTYTFFYDSSSLDLNRLNICNIRAELRVRRPEIYYKILRFQRMRYTKDRKKWVKNYHWTQINCELKILDDVNNYDRKHLEYLLKRDLNINDFFWKNYKSPSYKP